MISAVLIVKNGERHLAECLDALEGFAEIVLVDTGSTDRTREIARAYPNLRWFEREFIGFGPTKNLAAGLATRDWIFSIDADEVMTPELRWEIQNLDLDPRKVYRVPRQSYYNRKWIRGCGWYPDRVLRLYHRGYTGFNRNRVHESVQVPPGMAITDLEGALKHYPYDNADQLVEKARFYAGLYAEEHAGRKKASPWQAAAHGLAAFLKGYVLRRGWRDGYEGFAICLAQGLAAWLKYARLYEANRNRQIDA